MGWAWLGCVIIHINILSGCIGDDKLGSGWVRKIEVEDMDMTSAFFE